MPEIALLGPQVQSPNLKKVLSSMQISGPVAAVSAGWQERAGELEALRAHLDDPVINLELYFRAEEVFEKDPELFAALRHRQDRLRELQRLYRIRLAHQLDAVHKLLSLPVRRPLLEDEIDDSIEFVRLLDAHQLRRILEIHEEFERTWAPNERSEVCKHQSTLQSLVEPCSAVLVAGGHVATLLNRLRLFDLTSIFETKPLIAWSAGSMVLSDKIVLFHDNPPQGPGNAEVFEVGLGVFHGIVPLPHASRRLLLGDPDRVALFSKRYAPAMCLAMDAHAFLHGDRTSWKHAESISVLGKDGSLRPLELNG